MNAVSNPDAQPVEVLALHDFVEGALYDVVIGDCCVSGEFTATFDAHTVETDFDNPIVLFANGVRMDGEYLGRGWQAFEATESKSGATPTPG